jgi:hypothetical protein
MQGSLWQRSCPQAQREAAATGLAPAAPARLASSQRSRQISHGASRRQRRAIARQHQICASLRSVQSEGRVLRQDASLSDGMQGPEYRAGVRTLRSAKAHTFYTSSEHAAQHVRDKAQARHDVPEAAED